MTSRSPFHRYANAKLTLQIPTDTLRVDEETGNQVQIYESLTIVAILIPSSKEPKERSLPASNVNEIYLAGNLIEPMEFPDGIQPPLECEAEIDGRKGRIRLLMGVRSPYGVERKTGRFIQGYFQLVG